MYSEDEENVLWDDEEKTDDAEARLSEAARRQIAEEHRFIEEMADDAEEHPIEEDDSAGEPSERKQLKRELRAQALARLEDAARAEKDFENIIAWWNKLDANRERRERDHELFRSGDELPLDYGTSEDALFFPGTMNHMLARQERKGDFLDSIFCCPYEIHELVADEYLSDILWELKEEQKFLLFLCALQQYSSKKIAKIREQTDRNIRKVRATMFKKIRKKLFAALQEKAGNGQPLTISEKEFLADYEKTVENCKRK
ncbi:MAG: hypothetical protein LUD14_05555 [Clostridiales bacterium]|nr:hypothetical protein [Clostridiales bacterium]